MIGTGIGGGLILGGTIYRGFSNVGGELGHITLNPWGYRCNCGNTGCFEAYCGGLYITSRIRQHIEEGYRGKIWELIGGDIEALHPGYIEEAAARGDDLCARTWREVIEYLGCALQSIANLLNPEVIMLGGRVILGTSRLVDEAVAVMRRRAMSWMPGTGSSEGISEINSLAVRHLLLLLIFWQARSDTFSAMSR